MAKKKTKRPKLLAPYQAKDIDQVCMLNRDNINSRTGWILTDGYTVTLTKQKPGNPSTASVDFTPKEFERFARWFLKPQKLRTVGKTGEPCAKK